MSCAALWLYDCKWWTTSRGITSLSTVLFCVQLCVASSWTASFLERAPPVCRKWRSTGAGGKNGSLLLTFCPWSVAYSLWWSDSVQHGSVLKIFLYFVIWNYLRCLYFQSLQHIPNRQIVLWICIWPETTIEQLVLKVQHCSSKSHSQQVFSLLSVYHACTHACTHAHTYHNTTHYIHFLAHIHTYRHVCVSVSLSHTHKHTHTHTHTHTHHALPWILRS